METNENAVTDVETRATADPPDAAEVLAQRSPQEVEAYHRTKRYCHLGGLALSIVYWTIWLFLADDLLTAIETVTAARWLALPLAALAMFGGSVIIGMPLGYYSSFIVERRYDLTNQTPGSWLVFEMKGWLVGVILGGILLAGLYSLLWYAGNLWSLWLWIGFMVFSIGLAKLFPLLILPLFYPSTPLERPSLAERLEKLAGEAGMKITGIFNLGLSKETKKANAMLAGLGSSRRVYLSDTLLDAFNDDQIAVVFAHELGHHIRGHITKSIAMAAVVTSVLVALIHWRLNPYAGSAAELWSGGIAGLAQVGFLLTVYPLAIGPITNAVSRYFEHQADEDALRLTDDPAAYRTAFERLTTMNLADPNPPAWEVIMFDDHPPMAQRIARADRYVSATP